MDHTYELFHRDVAAADDAFRVTVELEADRVRYVEAEADTGTRYALAAAWLPVGAELFAGASVMVSVISPWPNAYPMQPNGELHIAYVAEKFAPRGRHINGGDLAALTLTIAHALHRKAVLA